MPKLELAGSQALLLYDSSGQRWGCTCSCCFRCSFSLRRARSTAVPLGEVTALGLLSAWLELSALRPSNRSSNCFFSSCKDLQAHLP